MDEPQIIYDYNRLKIVFPQDLVFKAQTILKSIKDVLQNSFQEDQDIKTGFWILYLHQQLQTYYLKKLSFTQIEVMVKQFNRLQSSLVKTLANKFEQEITRYEMIRPYMHEENYKNLQAEMLKLQEVIANQQRQREKIELQLKQQQDKLTQYRQQQQKSDLQNRILLAQCLKHLEYYSRNIYKKNHPLKSLVVKLTKNIQRLDQKYDCNKIHFQKQINLININIQTEKSYQEESHEKQILRQKQHIEKKTPLDKQKKSQNDQLKL